MAMYDRAPRRIPETLQTLLDAVSEATGTDFNFVLMNYYQDGTHSISYHSDDEKFLGGPRQCSLQIICIMHSVCMLWYICLFIQCRVISWVSLSLTKFCHVWHAASLRLVVVMTIMMLCAGLNPTIASLSVGGSRDFLMKHKDDAKRKEKFPLEKGDMLVMQGTTQSKWLHSIPKRTSSVQPRVNITFRKAMNAAGTNNYYKYNVGDGGVYHMINGKMSQTT